MCTEAGMRGTILLSPEGINIFVAAARPAIDDFSLGLEQFPNSPT